MRSRRHPAGRWRIWLARLYVLALVLILAMSLTGILAQKAQASEAGLPRSNETITNHGKTTQTLPFGESAAMLLQQLKQTVSGEDVASHGMEDRLEEKEDRVITAREVYTAALPHEVIRCKDPTLPRGTEQVLTPGADGEIRCEAEVTYRNGVEIKRVVLSRTVTRPAVTEIIGIGIGEEISPEEMGKPVIADGIITLPTGEVLTYTHTATVRATAYTHTDEGCDFITATGTTVHWGTVAVDPRFIPYGTRMFIAASNGSYIYGIAVAEDCGGDIKGDRMDLYMPTYEQCMEFGRRVCTIYYLG